MSHGVPSGGVETSMLGDRGRRGHRRRDSGQALVLMVGLILVGVAMVGLIVDGGNVLSQQRIVQTGADATAESGAVLLAKRLAGASDPTGGWDATIAAKLAETAAANGMSVQNAYYTDVCGIPLKLDGSAALTANNHEDLASALAVGNATNSLPAAGASTPDCPNRVVGPVAGVLVQGTKNVAAYVARAINIPSFTVTTRATAVAGYLQGYCDSSQGAYCALLPVAIPVNVMSCNGNNSPADTGVSWTWNTVVKIPLCSTAAGNVGWLDWTPPGGGSGELVCSILHADNPAIDLPSWQYVTQTGNTNGGGGSCGMTVEEAIRTYDGRTILIPQFDLTCGPKNSDPDPSNVQPAIVTPPNFGCPVDVGTGNGNKLWYRMPSFAFFQLCDASITDCHGMSGAYIQGNDAATCNTGNGATSCLVGKFVNILATGTVGAGVGSGTGNKALGVQLIK
jgi:Putative Flp pilus-assembly TadE/G-like